MKALLNTGHLPVDEFESGDGDRQFQQFGAGFSAQ